MALVPAAVGPAAPAKMIFDRVIQGWQTQADSSAHTGPKWLFDRDAIGLTGTYQGNVTLRLTATDPATGNTAWFLIAFGFKWISTGTASLVGSVKTVETDADGALAAVTFNIVFTGSGFGVQLQGAGAVLDWTTDIEVTGRKVA